MGDVASQGDDHQRRAYIRALTEAISEPRTLRAVIAMLEAVYAAHGWPLPPSRPDTPMLCSVLLLFLTFP